MDGAGASHDLVDHFTKLNTARRGDDSYGRRGRRVEYSIGWPFDARTRAAIEQLRDGDWSTALRADGKPDTDTSIDADGDRTTKDKPRSPT